MKSVDKAMVDYYEQEIQKSYREWDRAAAADYERTEQPKHAPKPQYAKGDTRAASQRIAELRFAEAIKPLLHLKVDQSLVMTLEQQAAKASRFQAVVEGVLAQPRHPAKRGECQVPRAHIPWAIKPSGKGGNDLARTPAIIAVVAVRGCRWPTGDPRNGGAFCFCNKKRVLGTSYCADHAKEAHK